MVSNTETDLNATISSAVQAQISARIAEALSGEGYVRDLVVGIVNRPYEVQDPGFSSRKRTTTLIDETIRTTITAMTKAAVTEALAGEQETIGKAVKKAVKARAAEIGEQIASQVTDTTKTNWRVEVNVRTPERY